MSMGMREKNGKTGRLIEMKLLPGNRVLSIWRARQEFEPETGKNNGDGEEFDVIDISKLKKIGE